MDKVVIFDWGGVVENHENDLHDEKQAILRLIKRFNQNISDEEILKKWSYKTSTGKFIVATNDKEDIDDWFNLIRENMNISVTFDEFKIAYEEEFSLISYYKDVVEYAHSLKDKCKIAILSNLGPFEKKRINDQYDLSKFDYVYLSYELGLKKPDKKIFEYVLNDLKLKPKNILFIDDNLDNIDSAKECGWNTCQAYGYELAKIKSSVEKFLNTD